MTICYVASFSFYVAQIILRTLFHSGRLSLPTQTLHKPPMLIRQTWPKQGQVQTACQMYRSEVNSVWHLLSVQCTHTQTHPTQSSMWTTKIVSKKLVNYDRTKTKMFCHVTVTETISTELFRTKITPTLPGHRPCFPEWTRRCNPWMAEPWTPEFSSCLRPVWRTQSIVLLTMTRPTEGGVSVCVFLTK